MPCGRLARIERGEAERLPPERKRQERGRKEAAREVRGRAGRGIGMVGDPRRAAGDVGEEEILRLAARGYWKEARRDERRSWKTILGVVRPPPPALPRKQPSVLMPLRFRRSQTFARAITFSELARGRTDNRYPWQPCAINKSHDFVKSTGTFFDVTLYSEEASACHTFSP